MFSGLVPFSRRNFLLEQNGRRTVPEPFSSADPGESAAMNADGKKSRTPQEFSSTSRY
jgi:hypothetical protein